MIFIYSSKDLAIEADDTFWFELPNNLRDISKYIPEEEERRTILAKVPAVVKAAILQCMGPDVPIDAMNTFYYIKRGWIPNFVVIWFIRVQPPASRLRINSIFFKALHLIEMFREEAYFSN